jgi:hypothetical protein
MRLTLILLHCLLLSFLKNLKLIFSITHFLLNLFPSLDGYTGFDLALCLFISLIIFIDHSCHVISFHCLFLFYLYPTVSENKWSSAWCSTFTGRGVDLCQTLGGPILSLPTRIPFPSFLLSLPPFSSFPLSPLLLPSLPFLSPPPSVGVRGLRPRNNFFRYTCSHASFSAFLTQKSAVYLTRFSDNNFAFLQ